MKMRRAAALISMCFVLWGCGTTDEKSVGLDVRQLSDAEKQSLAQSFSQKLTDQAAQFKWMPILGAPVAESSWIPSFSSIGGSKSAPPLAYCALVSEHGGPYRIFSATIAADASGQYVRGTIGGVDAQAAGQKGGTSPGAVAERCRSQGFADFSLAH